MNAMNLSSFRSHFAFGNYRAFAGRLDTSRLYLLTHLPPQISAILPVCGGGNVKRARAYSRHRKRSIPSAVRRHFWRRDDEVLYVAAANSDDIGRIVLQIHWHVLLNSLQTKDGDGKRGGLASQQIRLGCCQRDPNIAEGSLRDRAFLLAFNLGGSNCLAGVELLQPGTGNAHFVTTGEAQGVFEIPTTAYDRTVKSHSGVQGQTVRKYNGQDVRTFLGELREVTGKPLKY